MSASNPETTRGPGLVSPLIIVALSLALRFVPGWVAPMTMVHFMGLGFGPVFGVLGLAVWWMFARRVPLGQRFLGLLIGVGVLVLGFVAADPTMVQVLVTHAVPLFMVVLVGAIGLTRALTWQRRRWILVLAMAVAIFPWTAMRQDGQVGDLAPQLAPRWKPTAEERFLAGHSTVEAAQSIAEVPSEESSSDWPGFRGPLRDGRTAGVSFDRNWDSNPPRELWRRRVGPGWSSFSVAGDRVYTQEQRGDDEVVTCYSLEDGREIWAQGTRERFEEPSAGPGPRATPTFDRGAIFATGAGGTVQRLDAVTGERRWQRNLQEDVEAPLPTWGFSSSPAVVGNAVVVFAGGADGGAVVAYDRETGDVLWSVGDGGLSYSSAHPARIGEVDQVLISTDLGVQALDPQSGALVWEHPWPTTQMPRIVQPVVLDTNDSVILATGYGYGSRRLRVERATAGDWEVQEVWSTKFLKPYFNDLVCHRGSCYGFDGRIFTCIGADDGKRRWKGGRYGHGQVVLLPEMGLLLVLTEEGEVVLLEATPEAHREVARFPALTGKTWNHPVITQGKLLVRNAEEAACFELPASAGARALGNPHVHPGST